MSIRKDVKKELLKIGRADLKMKISHAIADIDDEEPTVENVVNYLLVKYPKKKIYTKNIIVDKNAKLYHS